MNTVLLPYREQNLMPKMPKCSLYGRSARVGNKDFLKSRNIRSYYIRGPKPYICTVVIVFFSQEWNLFRLKSINKKMCQIWQAGTDRSTWIFSFNFSEAISSTYANRGTSLGRIEEGLVVVSGYSSSSELEVELFANSYWFEQPSFPDCVSNFWRYSVATVDNTVFTIGKWSKITIEIECNLICRFPTVSYAAYYAWYSNWPISALEKRLRETKRS